MHTIWLNGIKLFEMEPKDLKNPEGLKSTENSEPKELAKAEKPEKELKPEVKSENTEVAELKNAGVEEIEPTQETVDEIQDVKTEETEDSALKTEGIEQEVSEDKLPEEVTEVKEADTPEEVSAEKTEVKETLPETETDIVKEKPELKVENTDNEEVETAPQPENKKVKQNKTAQDSEQAEEKQEKESVAEPKNEEGQKSKPEKKIKIDYTNFSQVDLINSFREILDSQNDYDEIKEDIDAIKAVFYKNLNDNIEEAKKKFLEDDEIEEEFVAPEDPYEGDMKDLLKKFRLLKIEQNRQLEKEKEENLKLKYQVIEDIKSLINNEESINKTFNEFRDLQRKWREIGLVPQSKMKNLWDTYHFHVENFYNYIKINKELRDLDLKKNLEAKIVLCERAEELLLEPSIIKAFNTLQKYHEQWREIGPVPIEQKDDIWERFKAATSKINKKHQEFFENRKSEQKKNLDAKIALCEKVEEILAQEILTHKEWDDKSRELVELQKLWRTIGFAPRKDNNKIYDRFRTTCDKFFDAKRSFYSKNKEHQQNNLQLKIDMCVEAEAMKDSTDWKKTTLDFIKLQKKWKEIGPVPRKQSDQVWKRFRAACDYFFEKKSEHFSSLDTEQVDNLKAKQDLVEEIKAFKPGAAMDKNMSSLKEVQRRWTEIGHVPFKKKDEVQNNYREAIHKLYDVLNLDEEQRNMLKFKTKMNTFSESNRGQNKMRFEREKYMNKLKQLESDLVLLDNNIGFFAKSKNAESLIADVKRKIENTKQKIENIKEKIRVIDDLDKME